MMPAVAAANTIARTMPAPIAPSGRRRMKSPTAESQPGVSKRLTSAVADTGIEPRIGDIDREIDEQEHGRDQHHQGLGERVIAPRDRFDEEHPEAVQVEHLL